LLHGVGIPPGTAVDPTLFGTVDTGSAGAVFVVADVGLVVPCVDFVAAVLPPVQALTAMHSAAVVTLRIRRRTINLRYN
jgi:hypothetical protein